MSKLKKIIKENPVLYKNAKRVLRFKHYLGNALDFKWYYQDLSNYKEKLKHASQGKIFSTIRQVPYLGDKFANAGSAGQYFYQDLWAAKKIAALEKDKLHYDIGSRVDGFIAHLLSFRETIVLIDIRPLPYYLDDGIRFLQADATNLENIPDHSIDSLSALCSLEHFGLGRYGDPIDPDACFKAFDSIQRVLKKGGKAFISLPIGKQCVEFNAHRIFYPQTVVLAFNQMKLLEFSVTGEKPEDAFIKNADIKGYSDADYNEFGYFGLFEFEKR